MAQNKIEKLKLFVANLMNEEQKKHSELISDLRKAIGKTEEFDNVVKILSQVYDAKIEILDKIYKEMQGM